MVQHYYHDWPDPTTMARITLDRRFGMLERIFDMVWATAGMIYFPIQNMYTEMAIVCVALGNAPKNWPPIFGRSPSQVTTIRAIWNTFWHQVTRNTFTTWSHGLMRTIGIRHGSWLSTYFQLYFSFLFTGIGHGIVTYAASYHTRQHSSFQVRLMPWVTFYLCQAVAIHVEDFAWWCYASVVSDPNKRAQQAGLRQVIGWLWVLSWWTACTDAAMLVYFRTGLAAESPLPFSLSRILLEKGGWLSPRQVA